MMCSIASWGQNAFFSETSTSQITYDAKQRVINPNVAHISELNVTALQQFLYNLPEEFSLQDRSSAPVLSLPMPDGSMERFRVWKSSVMEPALAAKFPEITTYAGQSIDNPSSNIRFGYDPYFGFNAQIIGESRRVFIDPLMRGNVLYYQSYHTADYHRDFTGSCLFDGSEFDQEPVINNATEAGPCRGTVLFTYRIAVACTGEYARAATGLTNPTVAQALAKIVTTVNRVNSVYENEIAVRLLLIGNNDQIVYTDPTTDPFTGNNNAGVLISESQSVITANIGTANFDIGHTFSTGGGGLAGKGVVCIPNYKASGITGSDNPVGDPYDIDFVAHEVGHQFGADHTFNSNLWSCNGNREGTSAYEVGAGNTIMAYAGLCNTDNIQNQSNPYFHSRSYDQIATFITTGAGSSCRVVVNTGNTLPVIDPLPNNNSNIPMGTPFELSGSATDADGDALTYSWEQWDLGPTTTWNGGAGNGQSPIFKPRPPKTTGVRMFPDIQVILAGYPANPPAVMNGLKGEVLSTVARSMKFRLTVRDSRSGGGSVVSAGDGCQSSSVFQVTSIAGTGPFIVTAPNGGESYPGGSTQTITWNVAGTDAAPINTTHVKITLSTDGGLTYPYVITNSTPNDGMEDLTIPVVTPTTTARVKIQAVDNVYFDISNNNFSITTAVAPTFNFDPVDQVNITCGTATTASASLLAVGINGFTTPVDLSATGAPAGTNVTFSANPATPGTAVNVILNNVNTLSNGSYTITVTGTAGTVVRTTDITYVVSGGSAPAITNQPATISGCAGSNATFNTSATGATAYQWQVSTDGGTSWTDVAGATGTSYSITGIGAAQNGHQYRVVVSNNCNSVTSNAASLNVVQPPVISAQPADAYGCNGGTTSISVTSSMPATFQWQESTDGGATFTDVAGGTNNTLNLIGLTLAMDGNVYRVVITNTCGTTTSNTATLTMNTVATITTQPVDVNICSGLDASFTVAANGSGILYQWQVSTDNGATWSDITGATSGTLNLTAVPQSYDGNQYRAHVSSSCAPTGANSDVATLTVYTPVTVTTQPANTAVCIDADATFTVAADGTGLSYQWEVSTNGGAAFTAIPGATNASYTITGATPAIDGNVYRVVVTGVPCGVVTSNAAVLTVNPVPDVTINGTGVTALYPGLTTVLTAQVVPGPASAYQWYLNGDPIPNATGETYTVTSQGLGTYTVTATAANGCIGSSVNSVAIGDSAIDKLFIYPNPNTGQFVVSYYSVNGMQTTNFNTTASLTIFDSKGARVYTKQYNIGAPYQEMFVDFRNMGKGVYWVELTTANGRRIKTGRVIVQ